MSWSLSLIGTPNNIVKHLEEHSSKLDGKSKEEFDAALPHLVGLVKQNNNSSADPILKFTANGHGYSSDSNNYNNCNVVIEGLAGILV